MKGLLAEIKPVWNSEIEPFPVRVTEKRLPEVQHFMMMCKIHNYQGCIFRYILYI